MCADANGSVALDEVLKTFRRWLHLPDPTPLLTLLATVAANRMPGDPVWLLLVGPPGSGKSELIESLRQLDDVHATATLTEAALLSGTPKREHAKESVGGLLRVIGDRGIILCKDFGSVLSMNRDARAGVLAALREIYDGNWTRHVGTDGGKTLSWVGHVGFVGGCPPIIDRHHAVMATLGERFLLLRFEQSSGYEQAQRALNHAGHEARMRPELTAVVAAFFKSLRLPAEPLKLSERDQDALVRLASLVSRCRSAVERDGFSREVELYPGAESPTRLVVTLKRLHDGLAAIGVPQSARWAIVQRVAMDSMPAIRRRALEVVHRLSEADTTTVAVELGYPTSTTRRALEDLAAYGVIDRIAGGSGKSDRWIVGKSIASTCEGLSEMSGDPSGTVPETSDRSIAARGPLSFFPHPAFDDISEKPSAREQA